ncbi:hypothetical protein [Bacillus sp. USDA818B3_A]|uniref:hypothetical protein n=1 Tax=Bacillus sp. USDA818B3_A TaxID=2698834 RepID=UPI00136E59E7|nr:hypothetical protein [Bacillus sp. USDA818B3_A]
MERTPITFQGKDYILLYQYESGYCEIVKVGEQYNQILLVHLSEIKHNQINIKK